MPIEFELLMVDDGSPDGAWPKLRSIAERDPRVKALLLSRNYGQHPATAGTAVRHMSTSRLPQPLRRRRMLAGRSETVAAPRPLHLWPDDAEFFLPGSST
jgi:hypothetical protein